jgi:hypothetical protein
MNKATRLFTRPFISNWNPGSIKIMLDIIQIKPSQLVDLFFVKIEYQQQRLYIKRRLSKFDRWISTLCDRGTHNEIKLRILDQ